VTYFRPTDLSDALQWLSEDHSAADRRIIAGCTDIFPATTAQTIRGPLLDVTAIRELRGITEFSDHWRFGATTTWTDVIRADLPAAFDGLKSAAREVGSVQIQNSGTLAGNLCNASPAADGSPVWLTLDASVELLSLSGSRVLPIATFLLGPRRTALAHGEIMTAILVPKSGAQGRSIFVKLGARKYLVISIAMVAVRLVEQNGLILQISVAVGSCSAVPTRLPLVEAALTNHRLKTPIGTLMTDDMVRVSLSPITDVRGDAAYRLSVATELVRRSITDLAGAPQERAA